MMFNDRVDAAMRLVPFLEKYRNKKGVVLAVPRGGVPLGVVISKKLNFPMELILTKKIGHPESPEFAIGAVSMDDVVENHPGISIPEYYIEAERKRIQEILKDRYRKFMGNKKPVELKGKTVILIDDGMATGSTILSSLKMIRRKNPETIVLAVPVAPPNTVKKLKPFVDDLICLYSPVNFRGVGQFYSNFEQVTDEEVLKLINSANGIHEVA